MDELDLSLLICVEDKESSEQETRRWESDIYKNRETEGAYKV